MTMSTVQMAMPIDVEHGEVAVYRMTLPFLPPSKNVYDAWPSTWKSSAKHKWIRHVTNHCLALDIPKGLMKVGLAAKLVFPSNSRRDPQNYAQALWNWVPDALVKCGVLLDDCDGRIEIGPNWGVELVVDNRTTLPKQARCRTVLTVAFKED